MGDNILPEEIKTEIPAKLAEFIDKLTKDGYFNSRDDFARCSMEIIAQLYGMAKTSKKGKSLLDVLQDNGSSKTATPTSSKTSTTTSAKPPGTPTKGFSTQTKTGATTSDTPKTTFSVTTPLPAASSKLQK